MPIAEVDALYKGEHPKDKLKKILESAALSPGWRWSFEKLLDGADDTMAGRNSGLASGLGFTAAWDGFRPLKVTAVKQESEDMRSFVFASCDGSALPGFVAAQHIAVQVEMGGSTPTLTRMYSLSGGAQDGIFCICVKREHAGTASDRLHLCLNVGDIVRSSAPRGTFALSGRKPGRSAG